MDRVPITSEIADALIYELRKKFPQFTYSRKAIFRLDEDAEEHNTNNMSIGVKKGDKDICDICICEGGIIELTEYAGEAISASTQIEQLAVVSCSALKISRSHKIELYDPASMDTLFNRIQCISACV